MRRVPFSSVCSYARAGLARPAVVVAAQLGHASSAITHAVYEHLLDDAG
jgi:integrase